MKIVKLYVGCALTGVPEQIRNGIAELKKDIKIAIPEIEVLEFLGLTAGTATDVYEYDIGCVKSCDFFLGICNLPSLGLGFEIAAALQFKKPSLIVGPRATSTSRLIIGAVEKHKEHARFGLYGELPEIIPQLKGALASFSSPCSGWRS